MAISGSKWNNAVKNQRVRPQQYFFEDHSQHVADHDHDLEIMVFMSLIMTMIPR